MLWPLAPSVRLGDLREHPGQDRTGQRDLAKLRTGDTCDALVMRCAGVQDRIWTRRRLCERERGPWCRTSDDGFVSFVGSGAGVYICTSPFTSVHQCIASVPRGLAWIGSERSVQTALCGVVPYRPMRYLLHRTVRTMPYHAVLCRNVAYRGVPCCTTQNCTVPYTVVSYLCRYRTAPYYGIP